MNFPDTLVWTWFQKPTNNANVLFWLTLCQFQTTAEVNFDLRERKTSILIDKSLSD